MAVAETVMEALPKNKAEELDDKPEGTVKSREFFWDSVVLFVVSAILGLVAVDVITEFIRGGSVACFTGLADLSESQESYINSFCSGSLPLGAYLPMFIAVHGVLIAVPHYLWLNHYGSSFDFFFQLASSLSRVRETDTGEYAPENYVAIQQLQDAFTKYSRNKIFHLYVIKLAAQLIWAFLGLVFVAAFFTNYDATFDCPDDSQNDRFWPLNETTRCVFDSLRLLRVMWLAEMALLLLVIGGLSIALLWCASTHVTELGSSNHAHFAFQSGLSPMYYVPWVRFVPHACKRFFTLFPSLAFAGPRICTDLDFLVTRLYRTDSGLGYVFKEVQIQTRLKELLNIDQKKLGLHVRRHQSYGSDGIITSSTSDHVEVDVDTGSDVVTIDCRLLDGFQGQERCVIAFGTSPQLLTETAMSANAGGSGDMLTVVLSSPQIKPNTRYYYSVSLGATAKVEGSFRSPSRQQAMDVSELKWRFKKCRHGIYEVFESIPHHIPLVLPDTMRGTVLGFAARAPCNEGAIDITFGNIGYAFTLARVFRWVSSINFSPFYTNSEADEAVSIEYHTTNTISFTCTEDILSGKIGPRAELEDKLGQVWLAPGQETAFQSTAFIVVGPIDKDKHYHRSTVDQLLRMIAGGLVKEDKTGKDHKRGAILITILPQEIAGKDVQSQFCQYVPPTDLFEEHTEKFQRDRASIWEWQARDAFTQSQGTPTQGATPPTQGATPSQSAQPSGTGPRSTAQLLGPQSPLSRGTQPLETCPPTPLNLPVYWGNSSNIVQFATYSYIGNVRLPGRYKPKRPPSTSSSDSPEVSSPTSSLSLQEVGGAKGSSDSEVRPKKVSNVGK